MRNFYLFLVGLLVCTGSAELLAQPTVAYFSGAATIRQDVVNRGGARFARFQANATGVRQYAFHIGTPGSPNYSSNWRPYTAGDAGGAISFNTMILPGSNVNSARFNSGGGVDGNTPSVTSGNYYTFNVGNSTGDNNMSILETSYNPVNITSVSAPPAIVHPYQTVNVTATLSATLNSGEIAVIRYTTDGFATSQFINMTLVSGTTYRGTIPLVTTTSTTVQYYVMTTNVAIGSLTNANADFLTLNLRNSVGQNVSGANFSYTTSTVTVKRTTGSGNFNAGIWTPAGMPGAGDIIVIQSGHTVTMNNGYTIAGLFINDGGTFTASDVTPRTLTITRGVTDACGTGYLALNNEGTFNRVNGTVAFTATGNFSPVFQVGGTVDFHNVSVTNGTAGFSTGVNFGSNSTINNNFTIAIRGYVCTNGPFYATNSNLIYNTTTAFTCGAEWYANTTSGQGVPFNVQLDGNNTAVTFGTSNAYRYAANNLTLNSGNPSSFSLSTVSGGDLKLGGNYNHTNTNAILNGNQRAIFLIGTGDQNFNTAPGAVSINYLIVDKPTGKVFFTGTGAQVTLLGIAGGDALQVLNYPTQLVLGSKLLSIHGTISWFAGSAFEGSSTASIALNNNTGSAPGQVELRFASGTENLNNLTVNRGNTGPGGVTLTSNLTLAGLLTLTEGTIQFGAGTARTLTANGGLSVGTGGSNVRVIDMSGGNLAHELILNGTNTFTNNLTSFLAGTGGATGSRVTYSGSGAQNVFGNHTYNRLALSGSGTKTLQNNNISVFSLDISGSADFNVQNLTVAGSATGSMSMGAGTSYTVNGGASSCAPFPTNFVRSNITLNTNSTVRFNYNADATVSTEPVYGNLVVNFSSGSGNKSPRCAVGPGGFTTLTVDGNLDFTRTNGTGGNNIFDLTLNGGFNLDVNGNLISTGLAGTAALNFNFASQNLNFAGSTNNFGNTSVGAFAGTQTGMVTYDGATAQTLRAMVHNNVTFTGAGLKSLAAGAASVHFRVNNTCTMSTAIVDLVDVNFDIAPAASITGSFSGTNMFRTTGLGLMRRYRDAAPFNFTFPVGIGSIYNPATVNITTATFGGAAGTRHIGVRVVGSEDPFLNNNDPNKLNVYWNIVPTNISAITNGNVNFTYDDAQVTGSDAGFVGGFNENAAGTSFQASLTAVNTTTNIITFSNAEVSAWNAGSLNGNWFAAALSNIPGAVVPFYTRQNGNWSDPNTWSLDGFGGTPAPTAPPDAGGIIRIGNGNTVTLDVSTVTSISDLQIQATGVFDIGVENFTGTSFTGAGTLRLRANSGTRTFPAFTSNAFLTTSGSVVEYNGNASYSLPATPGVYQSVVITGGGTKTLTGSLQVAENLSVTTSGTTFDLATFTFNRITAGGTFVAASGTTVRSAFVFGAGGQNAFPDNFSSYTLAGSTTEFYGTTNQQTINPLNYHNLILSGNRGGNTIRFSNSPTGVSGTFDFSGLSNYSSVWSGGSGRINFNANGSQFVPGGFPYQRIEISGNKAGATVTFDPVNLIIVRDELQFNATGNPTYVFTGSTIEYRGSTGFGATASYTISNNPPGFPFNNITAGGTTTGLNFVGSDVNINGTFTVSVPTGVSIGTGSLTMGTGSEIVISSFLGDNNTAGTNTLNNANITVNAGGTLNLTLSTASLGITTGTLTFNGGTVGGPGGFIGSVEVGNVNFTGNGTIGTGNFTSNGTFNLSSGRTLTFTSNSGLRTFNGPVEISGIWDNSANVTNRFANNINFNTGSTFTSGTGLQSFIGTSILGGAFPSPVNLSSISITAGSTLTNSRTQGVEIGTFGVGTGTFIQGANALTTYLNSSSITPAITATAAGNTFRYNAASSNVKSASYFNLDFPGGGIHVLGGNADAAGSVNLNSTSIIRTNANVLAIGSGGSIANSGSAAYVWGNLQKFVPLGNPTVVYEIGDASNATPLSLTFTSVSTAGDFRAASTPNILLTPGGVLLNKSASANRFWTLTNVNTLAFTSYAGQFSFVASDYIGGAVNADLRGALHDGSNWSYPATSGLAGESATLSGMTTGGTVILASCSFPVAFTLSGTNGGAYCSGGAGPALSLSGSSTLVTYQLQRDGIDEGAPVAGTGTVLALGNYTTVGAYTMFGTIAATGCTATMNGTVNVSVNPSPTLGGVSQLATVCAGLDGTINLTGLTPSSVLNVQYSINGAPQVPITVNANAGGNGSFLQPLVAANNGQNLEITAITNTSQSPSCTQTFNSANSVTLSVFPRPTVSISANTFVCLNQTAPIDFFLTGTGPWNFTYEINGVPQAPVNTATSPFSSPYINASTARTYTVTSLSDVNCTALVSGLDDHFIDVPIPCAITWNGSQSSSWVDKDNWTPNNSAPSPNTSVIIPGGVPNQPNLVADATCASFTMLPGSNPVVSTGVNLNLRGDLVGNAFAFVGGAGKLILAGTGLQTISGSPRVSQVDFANTSGSGIVIETGASLNVEPGFVATFLPNSRLTANGKLVLRSNATSTAKIGPIPSSAVINGNINQQRHIPHHNGFTGSWYFIGSPFSGKNFTDWSDNFRVSGLSSGFGSQGGGIISSPEPERSTIFKYVEADHNLRIDTVQKIGWTIPGAAENIVPGRGYRTFINYFSNSTQRFDNEGTITRGDFDFPTLTRNEYAGCIPATFPCEEESWRGWNLMANPYPCDVDWDAPGGWTKPAQMSNAYYRWNAEGLGYGLYSNGVGYVGAAPSPANPNLIPSGQGFFVRLAASGTYNATLSIKESAKVVSPSATFMRSATASNQKIRVYMSRNLDPSAYGYSAVVRFMEGASDQFDFQYDFSFLGGNRFNVSVPKASTLLSVASFPLLTAARTVPIRTAYMGEFGNYVLRFTELEELQEYAEVFLKDNLLGTLTTITPGTVYNYTASASDAEVEDRFELIFIPNTTTGNRDLVKSRFEVFPNPSEGGFLTIFATELCGQKAQIQITDALGRLVFVQEETIQNGELRTMVKPNLPTGMYTLQVKSGSKSYQTKWVNR